MHVFYVDHMGSDLTVVNAARVSFNKHHFDLTDGDKRLIEYLADHNHWTPFAHTSVTLHFKVPIFVARQIMKHQVGFVVNEVSRRYVSDAPDFFTPYEWREKDDNVKQGSKIHGISNQDEVDGRYEKYLEMAYDLYLMMLENGVCPEQARMVLPQSMYTEFWMTGSVAAWARMYSLRTKPDTQFETRAAVSGINDLISTKFPLSWEAMTTMLKERDE